jgi:uncharacterized coiled-coil protein SlyX
MDEVKALIGELVIQIATQNKQIMDLNKRIKELEDQLDGQKSN